MDGTSYPLSYLPHSRGGKHQNNKTKNQRKNNTEVKVGRSPRRIQRQKRNPPSRLPPSPVSPMVQSSLEPTCPFRKPRDNEACNPSQQEFKPCLRRLKGPTVVRSAGIGITINQQDTLDSLVSPDVWRKLVKIPGNSVDPVHMSLVPFFTSLQWKHGVYGTVGQIGNVGYGKFTSLLARVVDQSSGEQLFVADPFDTISLSSSENAAKGNVLLQVQQQVEEHPHSFFGHPMQAPSRHEVFAASVRDATGFDETSRDPSKRLFLYRGDILRLTRNLTTVIGDLPLFRIVALERFSESQYSSLALDIMTSAIKTAVCILSDGGLVVIDGSSEWLNQVLDAFVQRYGKPSFVLSYLLKVLEKSDSYCNRLLPSLSLPIEFPSFLRGLCFNSVIHVVLTFFLKKNSPLD
jgi:hypothetical protein